MEHINSNRLDSRESGVQQLPLISNEPKEELSKQDDEKLSRKFTDSSTWKDYLQIAEDLDIS